MFKVQSLCLTFYRLLLCWNCKHQYDRPLLGRILLPRGSGQCHTPGLQLHHGSLLPRWVRPARALLCWVLPGQYWVHLLSTMSSWKVHSVSPTIFCLFCKLILVSMFRWKRVIIILLRYNNSHKLFCVNVTTFSAVWSIKTKFFKICRNVIYVCQSHSISWWLLNLKNNSNLNV